jgi:hypothetical protein
VVMVLTEDGIGSGTIIGPSGEILTNWHVVGDATSVGIAFMPKNLSQDVAPDSILRATVQAVDREADLALLQLAGRPPAMRPVSLGQASDLEVGDEVQAIGHPTGEGWTYTRGFISQIRPSYEWTSDGVKHRADVIQTQTPISPGNSGGPLLTDDERLIGVNAFKVDGAEALNFAISVSQVVSFLGDPRAKKQGSSAAPSCEAKQVWESRSDDNLGSLKGLDSDCDGKADSAIFIPDDAGQGIELWLDRNGDDRVDAIIVDKDRDGKWDSSEWDSDFDGKFDLAGEHPDGDVSPSRYVALK